MSKKLEEKRDRRAAEERRRREQRRALRRRNLITTGIAVVVLAGVVGLIVNEQRSGSAPVGVEEAQANCTEVDTFEVGARTHIDVGQSHEPYSSGPPTSGPHYATPAEPGFYPSPLEPEQVVHNLEHGQLVIWYRPNAPAETIDQIETLIDNLPGLQGQALVAVPYDGVDDSFTHVLTAWGASQSCARVSQAVVDDFRERFQGRGPEQVGVPPFTGP